MTIASHARLMSSAFASVSEAPAARSASIERGLTSHLEQPPSVGEEVAHAVTHGVGAVAAAIGLIALVSAAGATHGVAHVVACAVYGVTLVLCYAASTVFHAVPARFVRAKRLLQRGDHAAIYLLIAGTYTPFSLIALEGPWGSALFAVIWSLAAVGLSLTAYSLRHPNCPDRMRRYQRLSLGLYVAMGWLALFAVKPLMASLSTSAFALVIAGGVAYTAGIAFFVSPKKWAHSIWHVFTLAGSGLHFASIFLLV
jgi:hemolysin III